MIALSGGIDSAVSCYLAARALGPENVLVFAGGPMTGVAVGGSGRNAVGAKAPLTGGYGEADAGGFFQNIFHNMSFRVRRRRRAAGRGPDSARSGPS